MTIKMITNMIKEAPFMGKRMKNIGAALLLVGAFAVPVAVPVMVSAQEDNTQIQGPLCNGASNLEFVTDAGDCGITAGSGGEKLTAIIRTIINIISVIVGVVAVVMIVVGGLKYITSGGESSNVSSAKNTIIYAIIGLVIVALAQFIVRFVLDKSINAAP